MTDTINPAAEMSAPAAMVAEIPWSAMNDGSTYIDTTVTIRLNAFATPMAEARISVGKSSFGYSHWRFPALHD